MCSYSVSSSFALFKQGHENIVGYNLLITPTIKSLIKYYFKNSTACSLVVNLKKNVVANNI